jgi:hypothetical protein
MKKTKKWDFTDSGFVADPRMREQPAAWAAQVWMVLPN